MTKIREYNINDQSRCIEIFNSNCPEFFDREEIKGFEHWLNGLGRNIIVYQNSEADFYYILEEDGVILACGGYYVDKHTKQIILAWGMVDNLSHKKGFGKALLQFRIEEIQKHYPRYTLVLDTSQHTYEFFQKFGFTVKKITKDGYGIGLDRYDMKLKV